MLQRIRIAAVCASVWVGGCAIHPLPEDVTGVPTYMIVRKIRCEARTGIKDNLTAWLKVIPDDPAANRLGAEFADGMKSITSFNDRMFKGQVRSIIQKFENSAIAYNFTFDITETNNIDATVDLLRPFNSGTGTAALTGGVDRTRENIRTFTITDTFIGLLTKVKDDYCDTFTPDHNFMYPITGNIGIGEMIHTFVELTLFANLSASDPTKGGPPTMGDTIAFTTKLAGSATPKIVLTPLAHATQLADASIAGAISRTDVHKVIVGLALPPLANAKATTTDQARFGLLVNAKGTSAELLAAHEIEQIITRFELGKTGLVVVPMQ